MTSAPLIELRGVLAFPGAAPVSLRVERGDRLALLGRNGIGKTTLLRAIAGLAHPAEGSLLRPPCVGYMPQDYRASLLPWLSVADNVALPLRGQTLTPSEREGHIRDALAAVSLPASLLGRWPRHLSGGEQQLVALARSLAWRAPVVLLDEPLSALDISTRAALRRSLATFMESRCIACVLVSHDLDDVLGIATRWMVLGGAPGVAVRDAAVSEHRVDLECAVRGAMNR